MKVFVIGTGNVAKANYLPVLQKREDVDLLLYNRTQKKAEEYAEIFGGTVCGTLDEAFAESPDTIFILTKETDRADVLRQIVTYKPKRVFLEKPLVAAHGQDHVSEEDFFVARELLSTLESGGTQTAMIFNYRFFEQTQRALQFVEKKSFGSVLNVTGFTSYACWSHVIDLMHYFIGPVMRLAAFKGKKTHAQGQNSAADTTATIEFKNGACGTLLGSWAFDFAFPLFDIMLNFEGGRVRMRGLDGELEVFDYSSNSRETYGITRNTSRWDWYKASFEKSITTYLDTIDNGSPPPIPGVLGLQELQVEAGIWRSIRDNRPVILDDEFSLAGGSNA